MFNLPIDFGFNRVTGQPFRLCNLLGTSTKVVKGKKLRVDTKVLYLLPAKTTGELVQTETGRKILNVVSKETNVDPVYLLHKAIEWNACIHADKCKDNCLATTSGHLAMDDNQMFMLAKTLLFLADKEGFLVQLYGEVLKHERQVRRRSKREGVEWTQAVRLNGGTDIRWPMEFFQSLPRTQFYDYTKVEQRMYEDWPSNYHLTFSWGSANDKAVSRVLDAGHNVAVCVKHEVGQRDYRLRYQNGDATDARFLDLKGGWLITLTPKGPVAKKDTTGFVKQSMGEVKCRLEAQKGQ
mgnify:CR=1 FL=1|tara:strand:+ start:1743 stop:2627 length:885 start_codon:yes stop_codon:yes gene_type:complete